MTLGWPVDGVGKKKKSVSCGGKLHLAKNIAKHLVKQTARETFPLLVHEYKTNHIHFVIQNIIRHLASAALASLPSIIGGMASLKSTPTSTAAYTCS